MASYEYAFIKKFFRKGEWVVNKWSQMKIYETIKKRYQEELDKRTTRLKRKITKEEALNCLNIAWNHFLFEFQKESVRPDKTHEKIKTDEPEKEEKTMARH